MFYPSTLIEFQCYSTNRKWNRVQGNICYKLTSAFIFPLSTGHVREVHLPTTPYLPIYMCKHNRRTSSRQRISANGEHWQSIRPTEAWEFNCSTEVNFEHARIYICCVRKAAGKHVIFLITCVNFTRVFQSIPFCTRFTCSLRFTAKEIDPISGEPEEIGYEDDYLLEDISVNFPDFVSTLELEDMTKVSLVTENWFFAHLSK